MLNTLSDFVTSIERLATLSVLSAFYFLVVVGLTFQQNLAEPWASEMQKFRPFTATLCYMMRVSTRCL